MKFQEISGEISVKFQKVSRIIIIIIIIIIIMEVALAPCAECGLKMSMKVASYEGARLRENDQTHRPSWNSTFFYRAH